jgi:hypothetical protein
MQAYNLTDIDTQAEELLAFLLEEEGITPVQRRAITRRNGVGPVPLSFAQQRL